ncbi:FKBP-type peptidyl-prolyl cis-trans isomerase [Niabella drilacis]|uniref:Peptidyl-prolyl cis-trans isomerase n=1 Tax=Niabella drilacis (strain DSM 25811 / CCM 8410 / CCUG 62505 / LMG 26954 / E90) TaxID=1285928 RepID=A0A1G6SI49_NIADE|nr:FKBP-type peptidyl-prolyl cis-trans isomerase [Niabella drilacis]SDD16344.1 FKBP-type peptidyl-prolyl cis-trans isomerase FkpA [Niabella drilacis]
MKKWFGLALIVSTAMIGCLKNDEVKPCTPKTVESEKAAMTKFATDSSITTMTDPSGLMYEIISPGTGATPLANSNVTAKYVGRFLNGKGFDSSYVRDPGGTAFPLNGVITGWQIGIPKIKEGGKIKLIVPSSLAYGCDIRYGQMANQPLYFYVELVKVQ